MRADLVLRRLFRQSDGAMAIETALVAPILVLLAVGSYQVSGVVARQTELQSAAAEAVAIALAAAPDTTAKRATVERVIETSSGLSPDKVTVSAAYRCDDSRAYVTSTNLCTSPKVVSSFVRIDLRDTYSPPWTRLGVGRPINYNITRYVLFQQDEV